jgi:hypothetical protein
MKWTPKINRGSTFRVLITIRDKRGEPVPFSDTTFTITPSDDDPIQLTPGNGKLTITPFEWKGTWSNSTAYVEDDVVRHRGHLWIARQANTGSTPIGGSDWEGFATFVFLVPANETADYAWTEAAYNWSVTRGNGDIEDNYLKGTVRISD